MKSLTLGKSELVKNCHKLPLLVKSQKTLLSKLNDDSRYVYKTVTDKNYSIQLLYNLELTCQYFFQISFKHSLHLHFFKF